MRTALKWAVLSLACAAPLAAQQLDSTTIAGFRWRSIGLANHQGRVVDVAGIPWPSRTFYVSSAGGGLWKTTNAGTSFRPVFEHEHVSSGGMIGIAPSDTNTIYYGTGEPNSRNSMSPGAGMWKSANGGRTWEFVGLKETQHIGRVVVDPSNKDIVYVAALGAAWATNKERGLYKTVDGGKTWQLKKFINDSTGFIDVALDPRDSKVVWAASYQRLRGPYFLQSGGKGSALWKSTDAGETWTEVKGGGLPETTKGRIGIAIAASNADVMYLMMEADTAANPKKDPKVKAQKSPSGLYRSEDGGKTWTKTSDENTRPFYYSQVRVAPNNPNRVFWSSTPVKYSNDGGKTAGNATVGIHVDHHAMWIDPRDPSHILVGNDGGVSQTWDNGGNWDAINALPIGQYYNVSFDNAVPYNVCGGAQDNGSWCGPSRRKQGMITNSMWFTFNGGDGFVTANDPSNPDIIFGESQGGNIGRYKVSTGERTALGKPQWRPRYMQWEDSILVDRPDTTKPMAKDQARRQAAMRAAQKKDSVEADLRWNWNTPFFISNHNPQVMYFGANRVLKSTRQGDDMYFISPDLSYADTMKIRVSTKTTGGITTDATGAETFGTIVSLNESPLRPGILYAGTDDGRLWSSWNDGGSWTEHTANVKGVPAGTYVSRIEPSHFDSLTFYVTYDNHRRGDFTPYVVMTKDGGKSFTSIASNLPTGGPDFVYVVREDPKNKDLLFVGTDVGAYASLNQGQSWQKFMTGLPTVPVMDLQIHPRDGELVAATHGRSMWIVDISALQQLDAAVLAKSAYLFKPRTAFQWGERPYNGESVGQKLFQVPSPAYGAEITYKLAAANGGPVKVVIQDASGDTLRTINGPGAAGINRAVWDFRGKAAPSPKLSPAGVRDSINNARQTMIALDSIEKEGTVAKPILDRIRTGLTGGPDAMQQMITQLGAFGGGGGGRFGGAAGWQDRPGESPAVAPGAAAGGRRAGAAPGAAAAPGAPAMPDQNELMSVMRAVMGRGGMGALFGGGRRGGGAGLVGTGDYLVTITAGGQTMKQVLHVERVSGGEGGGFPFDENDEHHEP
ncbi:MAG: WD40/YVTN/BNR-like repeat-containing protein [Gemmatimonadaceae bacterium]